MKSSFNKFIVRCRKVFGSAMGRVCNVLAFGGALMACCGVLPAGLTCLSFACLGYMVGFAKVFLIEHEIQQIEKYNMDYEVEDYIPENENIINKHAEVITKQTKTAIKPTEIEK